jgi:hypothetical protein
MSGFRTVREDVASKMNRYDKYVQETPHSENRRCNTGTTEDLQRRTAVDAVKQSGAAKYESEST